jgi:hypothetical protein
MIRVARVAVVLLVVAAAVLPLDALEGCKACMEGTSAGGYPRGYCTDPGFAQSHWSLYANCRGVTYCEYMAGGGWQCWAACTGNMCYQI